MSDEESEEFVPLDTDRDRGPTPIAPICTNPEECKYLDLCDSDGVMRIVVKTQALDLMDWYEQRQYSGDHEEYKFHPFEVWHCDDPDCIHEHYTVAIPKLHGLYEDVTRLWVERVNAIFNESFELHWGADPFDLE